MPMQLEQKLAEEWAIDKLKEKGWSYIESDKLNRLSFDEPLLINNLKEKIIRINKDIELTEEDLNAVINKLRYAPADQNGHKEILNYFKYGVPIKIEKERIVKNIQLFDYKNIQNNDFVVTNQFKFIGRENIRLDILLLINGIPLANIECKNPYTDKKDYFDAYKQIKRYEKTAPELYKYIQIGIGLAEVIKYFPIVPWFEEPRQEIWRYMNKCEKCKEDEAIFEMLEPEIFLDIIKNFIFLRETKGEMTKVIARYMQYRAANKIYQRVIDNLNGKTNKNKGLIWHWQGSGKTLTMIFAAHKLYFELGKPTIFFIVDRRDLERQFNDELSALELNFDFERIESINALREILIYDDYRGKRGVFLTLIHKFNLDEEFLLKDLEEKGEIKNRKDIICFLDEVHRDQYGKVAGKMRNILKNAFFFGFTGTPISYEDRNTYKEFGYIEEGERELYLDKYFMDEAEKDGFIVPIVYELKKEKIKLKDEDLEWYLKQIDIEDIGDEAEVKQMREEIKKRINEIKVILENPNEIEKVCQDIAKHFNDNFDGKFKGLIVTGSRKACVRYKTILDKYLPSEYSEVVMTFNQEDDEEIQEYRRKLIERFQVNDTNQIIAKIIEQFRQKEYPKLLIVTDMLITGFDEPKLGALYLHKLLKNHRLLQTIARVNRPYLGKDAGLIVDYVGIFKLIGQAFKAYSDEDAKAIKKAIREKKDVFDEFLKTLDALKNLFGDIVGNFDRSTFDKALEILKKEDTATQFLNLYRDLRNWYEFLATDERMVKYLTDYKWFSVVYEYYKKIYRPIIEISEDNLEKYFKKTINLIHQLTEVSDFIQRNKPTIIDLNHIKLLKKSDLTEEQKTIGTLNALNYICVINQKNPIYKSISDKVKNLIKKWQNDEIDISTLGIEVDSILEYIDNKEKEKEETHLNEREFGIKLILENNNKINKEDTERIAKQINSEIQNNLIPEWSKNPAISKEVSKKIREYLAQIKQDYNLSYEEFDKLYQDIFDYLTNL